MLQGQFVLFGDSITEESFSQEKGFAAGAALANDYQKRLDVVCRGFGGYTTGQGKFILPHLIPRESRIRVLVVFFGANDSVTPGNIQHIPLQEYKENLSSILTNPKLKQHNSTCRVIAVTPSPINEHDLDQPNHNAELTQRYAATAKSVAAECGVPCVDLWSAFMDHCGWKAGLPLPGSGSQPRNAKLAELLTTGGVHFTPLGYSLLYQGISDSIAAHAPELLPRNMRVPFPPWDLKPAREIIEDDIFPPS